jgi:two-component system OmpR family sensor kinase
VNVPIRVRLTALYVLVLAAIIAALTTFVVTRLRADLIASVDANLRTAAAQIALGYRNEGPSEFIDTAHTVLPGSGSEPAGAVALEPSGRALVATGALRATAGRLISQAARVIVLGGRSIAFSTTTSGARRVHLRVVAIQAERRGQPRVIAVVESLHDADNAVHRVLVLLALGGAGALALVAVGGWWIARRALRPVELMTTRAQKLGIDDLSQRVAVPKVRDELAHLAETLNAMLDRLQDSVETRRRLLDKVQRNVQTRQALVADASHELRSPLTAMRTELEVSLRQDTLEPAARRTLELVLADAIRLGRIVDNLLVLARIDEGRLELLKGSQDLRELVDRIARAHQATATATGVTLIVAGEHVRAEVDRDRVEQVLRNLLENAIRYAPVDSAIKLQLWQESGAAHLSVTDAGPGIDRAQREQVFERFSRENKARARTGGAGLGLAICREIVLAHGGRIWVEDRTEDDPQKRDAPPGTRICLTLPSTATPDPPKQLQRTAP